MSLESGHFTIFNEGSIASRSRNEDHSLNPKSIFCPAEADPDEWEFKKLDNGRFILNCRGAPTGVEDDKVVAYVNKEDQKKVEEWTIIRREPEGLYMYVGPSSKCLLLSFSESHTQYRGQKQACVVGSPKGG